MSNEQYQMETAEDAIKIALAMSAEKVRSIDSVVKAEPLSDADIIEIQDQSERARNIRARSPIEKPDVPEVDMYLRTNETTGTTEVTASYRGITTSFITPYLREYVEQVKDKGERIPYALAHAILAKEEKMIDTFFRPDAEHQAYRATPEYIRQQINALMERPEEAAAPEADVIRLPVKNMPPTPVPEAAYAGRR